MWIIGGAVCLLVTERSGSLEGDDEYTCVYSSCRNAGLTHSKGSNVEMRSTGYLRGAFIVKVTSSLSVASRAVGWTIEERGVREVVIQLPG